MSEASPKGGSREPLINSNVNYTNVDGDGDVQAPPKYRCYAIVHVLFAVGCFGLVIGAIAIGILVAKSDVPDGNGYAAYSFATAYGVNGTFLYALGAMLLRGSRSDISTTPEPAGERPETR